MKNKLANSFYSVTLLTPDILSIASTLESKMTSQTRVTTAMDADFLQKVMDRDPLMIIQWICWQNLP